MARSRNLKPGLFVNEQVASCSWPARWLFPALWTLADRDGRLEDRPLRIKAQVFPFDNVDVDALLGELAEAELIRRYEVDGERYVWIPKFTVHQNPHKKEAKSAIPAHPWDSAPTKVGSSPVKVGASRVKVGASPADSLSSDSLISESLCASPPPTPPRGESERGRAKKSKPAKFDPATVALPDSLDTPEFRAAWTDFALHRQGIRKPLTELAAGRVLKKLEPYRAATAAQAIDDAIAGGWQGVFPEKAAGGLQRPHAGNADQASPDGFDDFWLAYPDFKRTNQPAARREWGPSVARAGGAEIIIERVRVYAKAVARWPEDERRFVPAPASWLEGDRWGDDPAAWKRKGSASDPSTSPVSGGCEPILPSWDELPPVEDRRRFIANAKAAIRSAGSVNGQHRKESTVE